MSTGISTRSCENCRHHSTRMAPKPHKDADEFMDGTFVVMEDSDQKVYSCKAPEGPHAGTEIGPVPTTCDSWDGKQAEPSARDTRMKELLEAWEARQKERDRRSDREDGR